MNYKKKIHLCNPGNPDREIEHYSEVDGNEMWRAGIGSGSSLNIHFHIALTFESF